jgi:formaldehyde-activating enzyme
MAYLDNVIGIKDSSGDMPFMMTLLEKLKGMVSIFGGHDEIIAAVLAAGADGAILASANVIPEIWQEIYQAVQAGDLNTAMTRQGQIQTLVRVITRQGSVQAVKECLTMMGLDVGNARLPMMPGDAFRREDREELRIQLERLGKIQAREVHYRLEGTDVGTVAPFAAGTPHKISDFALRVGEGFAGPPFFELAHVDLLLGERGGPVDQALNSALGVSHPGHEVRLIHEHPRTLLVPTVTIRTDKQAEHIYEIAARGVVRAIEASIEDGFLPKKALDRLALIANVFVHPSAANRQRIEMNNYKAMRAAIRKAIEGRPTREELLLEGQAARHPFRYAP